MSKKQYGVVGHPIGHTLSPFIHTRLMSLAGIDGEYGVYHITPEEFGTSFEKLMNELDGINITIPYKQAVMRFLNETDKTAELYGSVNTISIKHTSKTDFTAKGYTTDGIGFSDALKNAGIPIGDNVTVVGCGGVGRVFVNTCLAQGSKHVNILECRQALDNAKNFAQSINERYGSGTASVFETSQFDGESNLLINASPIGMYPKTEACAVEDNVILKADNVFDAVYNPSETLLVKKAKDMGKKAITGMTMLVYQAAAAQTIWNSVTFATEDIKKLAEDCYKNIE